MSAVLHPVFGAPCWVSLSTPTLERAEGFYGPVLGWTFRPGDLGDAFSVALSDGVPVAGIGAAPQVLQAGIAWTPFFSVGAADSITARIRERGATVAVGPLTLGDGRAALAADPHGASFGLWEGPVRSSWDVRRVNPPARLELRTRDAFSAALFYGQVLEWSAEKPGRCSVEYRDGAVQIEVGTHTVAALRGGAVESAPDPAVRPRWHVSFYVDDVDDTVRAAVESGGTVTEDPHGEGSVRTAGLRDPEGALFSVASRK